jgi:hypothetical protein
MTATTFRGRGGSRGDAGRGRGRGRGDAMGRARLDRNTTTVLPQQLVSFRPAYLKSILR